MSNQMSKEIQKAADCVKKAFTELGKTAHKVLEDLKRDAKFRVMQKAFKEKRIFIPEINWIDRNCRCELLPLDKKKLTKFWIDTWENGKWGGRWEWFRSDGRLEKIGDFQETKEGERMMKVWIRSYSEKMAEAIQEAAFKKGYSWPDVGSDFCKLNAEGFSLCSDGAIRYCGSNGVVGYKKIGMRHLIEKLPGYVKKLELCPEHRVMTEGRVRARLDNNESAAKISLDKWLWLKKITECGVCDGFKYLAEHPIKANDDKNCALCVTHVDAFGKGECDECPLGSFDRCAKDESSYVQAATALRREDRGMFLTACRSMIASLERCVEKEEEENEKGKLTKETDCSNVASYKRRGLNYGIAISSSEPNCLIVSKGVVVPRVDYSSDNYYKIYFEEKEGGKS